MRIFRSTLAIFSALLFVFSANACVIAAVYSGKVEACCEEESGRAGKGVPCSADGCAPCAVLESGINLSTLTALSVPPPSEFDETDFAELLRRLAVAAAEAPVEVPDAAEIPSPPWRDVMTKAVPVRGPSFAA